MSGFELRTVRSRAGLCVSGRDLFSGRTTKLRCVERLDDDVVIWPARNRRAGVTYYYGLARKDVRRVEITSRSGMRTSAPTLVLKTPAGQPKVRLVLVRVPGHRVARSVRAQA